MNKIILFFLLSYCLSACAQDEAQSSISNLDITSDEYWKDSLTLAEFNVLRNHGTERAFTGEYWDEKAKGTYVCRACKLPLFESKTKFKSGTGWPSFYSFISSNVEKEVDKSAGMIRNEVHCKRCKGHLGHVFEDGPEPTGLRYCINSISLELDKAK